MLEKAGTAGDDSPQNDESLHARAACLINPQSGIANDFLNHFNEILLLVENLPILLPEMVDELLTWAPLTYEEYFRKSKLPGSPIALANYKSLPHEVRSYFNLHVSRLNEMAVDIVANITTHREPDGTVQPEKVADYCQEASIAFRSELELLSTFVNCGYAAVQGNGVPAAVV